MPSAKAPPKAWRCPSCKRSFGRRNQSHGCAPATTVEAFFDARPRSDREVFEEVRAYLQKLGPIVVLFKRTRTFAELRPRRSGLGLSVLGPPDLDHPRIRKTLALSANRAAYYVDLEAPRDVDRDVRRVLETAFLTSP